MMNIADNLMPLAASCRQTEQCRLFIYCQKKEPFLSQKYDVLSSADCLPVELEVLLSSAD
ncbi:MAG: hypothetical protein SPE59_01185 [Treponema sp.]|nr:hypothetical protein [Treponema sp.]